MFKKLKNQYLLTHHPLIWNTRLVPMIVALSVIHLFFFLAGYGTVNPQRLQEIRSPAEAGGIELYTFSILCSLGFIIVWLIFYLRNNAFKNFYIIPGFHSAKEFFLILFIIFGSISFFESHKLGVVLHARSITSEKEMVRDANVLNIAISFLPFDKADYFKLTNCGYGYQTTYDPGRDYFDTAHYQYNDSSSVRVRAALREKDAFSYKNYCDVFFTQYDHQDYKPASSWIATRNSWIDNNARDSIRGILQQAKAIAKKYKVTEHLDPVQLTNLVFVDSFNNVTRTIMRQYNFNFSDSTNYIDLYRLSSVMDFLKSCHETDFRSDNPGSLTILAYTALCFTILLLCYRLYSRRTFLFSIIGSIVWSIIYALFAISVHDDTSIWSFYIFLFGLFTVTALVTLYSRSSKRLAGVALQWHIFLVPFLLTVIAGLIIGIHGNQVEQYRRTFGPYGYQVVTDELIRLKFPVGSWVEENIGLIFRLNLLVVILYTAFGFTRLSKRWHIMPEE